jgi:ATP-binding cassette, subfamily B, bacterial
MRLEAFLWPAVRLGEAIDAVTVGIGTRRNTEADGAPPTHDADLLRRWCDAAAAARHLEAEPFQVTYDNAAALPAPSLVATDAGQFLAIVEVRGGRVSVIGSEGQHQRVSALTLAEALRAPLDASIRDEVGAMLAAAGVPSSRRDRAGKTIAAQRLNGQRVADGWHFRPDPGLPFGEQAVRMGLRRQLAWLLAAHAAQYALWLTSWWLIGSRGLEGRLEWGWISGWMLVLATIVPLQVWATWLQGHLGLSAAAWLKQRLLAGSLRSDPEDIRHEGVGHLLGRVIEAEAIEALALGGGVQALLAVIDLIFAALVLSFGVAGPWHAAIMALVAAIGGTVGVRYHRRRVAWAEARLNLTHDSVEHMAGHRTRMVQDDPATRHESEDLDLASYLNLSATMDRLVPVLMVAVPRTWVTLALAATVPAFLAGANGGRLAITTGGILIAYLAWRHLTEAVVQISGALIAWTQVRPLVAAAVNVERIPAAVVGAVEQSEAGGRLVVARDLVFRYPSRGEPAVRGATLEARTGDRLLLDGPSGGGKSTFASLLAGLRIPDAGLLLVRGLDRRTLGHAEWRRRVIAVPQFHENYVVSDTLLFNLLMGRAWPPGETDVADATMVCRELGLAPLVERMPGGLLQMVGEGGWQLSHGEKGRLFVARALLQRGDLMIFDESFAALDPDNLRTGMECVLERAPTLLVVAHP